jgi:hypothetical protein
LGDQQTQQDSAYLEPISDSMQESIEGRSPLPKNPPKNMLKKVQSGR